mgnify:CR=1 FL=1
MNVKIEINNIANGYLVLDHSVFGEEVYCKTLPLAIAKAKSMLEKACEDFEE